MSEYDNSNKGALFKNEKQNDRQPDYRGPINVAGSEYELSAWVKQSDKVGSFLSISVSPKTEKGGSLKAKEAKAEEPLPF